MPSIVDIAGNNQLLKRILSNAAGAIVGMGQVYERSLKEKDVENPEKKQRVGLSMFGVSLSSDIDATEILTALPGYDSGGR